MMWRGGCIIRSVFLGKIKEAYDKQPGPHQPAARPLLQGQVEAAQAAWRRVVPRRSSWASPSPRFSALAFYDAYRTERLPANLCRRSGTISEHTPTSDSKAKGRVLPHRVDRGAVELLPRAPMRVARHEQSQRMLVAQSGGPTSVINSSLRGVVETCLEMPEHSARSMPAITASRAC